MSTRKPFEAISQFISAMARGDLQAILDLYHPEASFVAQPGVVVSGKDELGAALAPFVASRPTLTVEDYQIVEAGDVALYCSRWELRGTGPDGKPMRTNGRATNVLRRQPDGNWLIAVDNPWGTDIVATV